MRFTTWYSSGGLLLLAYTFLEIFSGDFICLNYMIDAVIGYVPLLSSFNVFHSTKHCLEADAVESKAKGSSLMRVPSKHASRILTTFEWRHSVRMLISVNKHSRLSLVFTIYFTRMILIATCFPVWRSIASFTLERRKGEVRTSIYDCGLSFIILIIFKATYLA